MPGHDAVPLPGVYGPQGPPGMPNPRLPGSPAMPPPTGGRSAWEHKSDQTFPIDPGVRPQTPASKTWEWLKQHPPDSWGLPKPEDNTTGGIVPPPGGFEKPPESPNHVGDANPSNPSSGNNGALYPGAPGIPVSKPTNIPAGPARKKKPPGTPPGQWKNNDGAPGPGVVGTVTRPGIEAAGPPHQLFPQGNSSAGAGGSAAPDAGQTPTFSKAAENAVKPLEAPKPVNPLAWALIKGGAALMQSQHQFGQALGEGISAGAEGYMEAQNVDFENLRKVNDDARAQQREARETYRDTQLATFIAKENAAQAKRLNEIRTTDSDRTFNLGERKLGLEGTQEAHAYELGKGGLGVQQSNAATARGQLGVAQGQLDVAREELTPSAVREVESYMQQYIRLHPETPNTPEGNQKAYDEAWKAYQKAHPQSNNYFGGLDSLTGQPAQIPDGTVSGAVPP